MKNVILLFSFLIMTFHFCEAKKKSNKKVKKTTVIQKSLPLESEWILESIAKEFNTLKSLNKKTSIRILPNKTHFNGNAGCNGISGELETNNNNSIKFSKMIRTEMYCDNMQQEDLFLVLLEIANKYKIVGGELFLYKNEKLLMTLESFR